MQRSCSVNSIGIYIFLNRFELPFLKEIATRLELKAATTDKKEHIIRSIMHLGDYPSPESYQQEVATYHIFHLRCL
jgi:hypothetical protein